MSTSPNPFQPRNAWNSSNEPPSPKTYTMEQVAAMFSVCTRTVRRRWQDGTFPRPIPGLGRVVRFDAAAVERFRQQCNPK